MSEIGPTGHDRKSEPLSGAMPEPTVFCYECKHLVGKRHNYDTARNWQCSAPQNVVRIDKDPVTAMSVYHYRYTNCYEARQDHLKAIAPLDAAVVVVDSCGISAQWYEKYEPPYTEPRGSNPLRKPQAVPSAEALLKELEP